MAELKPGWTRVALGDIVDVVTEYWDRDADIPERFVAGEHIDESDLRVRRWGMTSDELVPPTFNRRFRAGDVLFHSRNLKKLASPDFPGITGEKIFVLRSRDSGRLLPSLLPYLLQTEAFSEYVNRMWAGSTNKFLNKAPLVKYEFALPPLAEQRRLTEALVAASRLQDESRALQFAVTATRRSLLVDIFRPDRGSRDRFPAHWSVIRAADAGHCQLGQQRHPMFDAGDNVRPYLRVANVFDGKVDLSDVLSMHFPMNALGKFELQAGDILLNEGQSTELVGRSAIWRGEVPGMCFQKTLLRFRCGPLLLPEFTHAYFQHMLYTGQFARVAVQTTSIAHLTSVRFAELPLPVPPIKEQEILVERLTALGDAEASSTRRAGDAARTVRQIVNNMVPR